MTTDPDPTLPTPVVPTAAAAPPAAAPAPTAARPKVSRRRTRRHPAAASRVLAAGLATASTFGLVAVIAGRAPATEVAASVDGLAAPAAAPVSSVPVSTPPPVVVVRRTYVPVDGDGAPSTGAPSASSSAPAAAPTQRSSAPPVTAAPRRSAPVARSSSS